MKSLILNWLSKDSQLYKKFCGLEISRLNAIIFNVIVMISVYLFLLIGTLIEKI
jgi:hypothetical protein